MESYTKLKANVQKIKVVHQLQTIDTAKVNATQIIQDYIMRLVSLQK